MTQMMSTNAPQVLLKHTFPATLTQLHYGEAIQWIDWILWMTSTFKDPFKLSGAIQYPSLTGFTSAIRQRKISSRIIIKNAQDFDNQCCSKVAWCYFSRTIKLLYKWLQVITYMQRLRKSNHYGMKKIIVTTRFRLPVILNLPSLKLKCYWY